MTRAQFMAQLRDGLAGMHHADIAEIMADYESHFADGIAAGRSEDEIAAALGDPARLARELRAEAGFRRWENERTPGSLAAVILALLGLATFDLMFMLPFVLSVAGVFLALAAVCLAIICVGFLVAFLALFPQFAHFGATTGSWALMGGFSGALAVGLAGAGLIAGGIGLGALVWLVLDFSARLLVRYARLHFRLLDTANHSL